MALTTVDQGLINTTSFKNRLINGAMMIDQRNAGASVTPSANGYTLDRWLMAYGASTVSTLSVQQSTDAPAGFSNSVKLTVVSTVASPVSTDSAQIRQNIEGYNIADFNLGSANASAISLSFWVKSSVTGTFGGAFKNADATRSYPFTYTISSANTWEKKTVSIAGDTTGTWQTTTSTGLIVNLSVCNGGSTAGTAGSWQSTNLNTATGCVNLLATNGATFYITGVQLEKGSTATSFDYRPYGTEFALCQRYYETNCPINTAPANGIASLPSRTLMAAYATDVIATNIPFLVQKRTTPTLTFYSGSDPAGTVSGYWSYYNGSTPAWVASTNTTLGGAVPSRFDVNVSKTASFTIAATYITQGTWAASAEL